MLFKNKKNDKLKFLKKTKNNGDKKMSIITDYNNSINMDNQNKDRTNSGSTLKKLIVKVVKFIGRIFAAIGMILLNLVTLGTANFIPPFRRAYAPVFLGRPAATPLPEERKNYKNVIKELKDNYENIINKLTKPHDRHESHIGDLIQAKGNLRKPEYTSNDLKEHKELFSNVIKELKDNYENIKNKLTKPHDRHETFIGDLIQAKGNLRKPGYTSNDLKEHKKLYKKEHKKLYKNVTDQIIKNDVRLNHVNEPVVKFHCVDESPKEKQIKDPKNTTAEKVNNIAGGIKNTVTNGIYTVKNTINNFFDPLGGALLTGCTI